ncbi:chemotaxis protein CheB [Persephonella sp.]
MIKFVVGESSPYYLRKIKSIIKSHGGIQVFTAGTGSDTVKLSISVKPQLVLADAGFRDLSSIEVTKQIKTFLPYTGVVVTSTNEPVSIETALKSLQHGASDLLLKSDMKNALHLHLESIFKKFCLIDYPAGFNAFSHFPERPVIFVGGSAGSVSLITKIVKELDINFKSILIILIHMPEVFTKLFARKLNNLSSVNVKIAENSENIKEGNIYIVKGGRNMIIDRRGRFQAINKETEFIPSIDLFLSSLVEFTKENTVGIILSGMGSDGSEGLTQVKRYGGVTVVQSPSCAEYGSMPESVLKRGVVDYVLSDEQLINLINQIGG